MKSVCFVVILSLLGSGVKSEIYFQKGSPHVKLESSGGGIFRGKLDYSRDGLPFTSFTGIKYAHIPERFAEAQLIENGWDGVKEAVGRGPVCTQAPALLRAEDGGLTLGEEDCLNLNVYVPMSTKSRTKALPVMVWIHGGGFIYGDGYSYNPDYFMDEEVILVTINYRLGVFGFLSTGDEVVPGNNALKDMVLALQWVQKNIKSFSGNAGKVTIFGESAGGRAAHFLLLSKLANKLFHRVISQSGTALDIWTYIPNPKKTAVELATYLKCPTSSSREILNCLKNTPMKELNEAQSAFWLDKTWPKGSAGVAFYPTADPSSANPFLPESPFTILGENRNLSDIPWMVGMTKEECAEMAGAIASSEDLMAELNNNWEEVAPTIFNYKDIVPTSEQLTVSKKIKEFYFGSKEISTKLKDEVITAYSDNVFNYGIVKAAVQTRRNDGGPVYLYQFAKPPPITLFGLMMPMAGEEKTTVGHGDDLIPLFGLERMAKDLGVADEKLPIIKPGSIHETFSRHVVKLWASFAKTGKPSHTWGTSTEKEWRPISTVNLDEDGLNLYKISDNVHHINNPFGKRLQFWDEIYKNYFEKGLKATPMRNDGGKTEL